MKKIILTILTMPLAVYLGISHAQEPSGTSVSTGQSHAEMRQQQSDGIHSRKENIAGAHKKAQMDPATRKARQQQKEGIMERKSEVAGAHQKARDAKIKSGQDN